MKSKLLIAALLCTTALTPTTAEAGPAVGFIAGALGVAQGAAIAATAAYGLGATFASGAIGGFVVRTVVAVGLSALAAALAPTPSLPPPAAQMVNFAQPVSYAQYVWGRTRKGGPIGFTGFTGGKRYYVPILAAHEIEGFVEHWLDERTTSLTAESDQLLSNVAATPMAGYGRINPFTGGSGQAVDAGLDAAFSEITSAHDFKGLAGAVIWAKRPPQASFTEIYPNGRQWAYAPVIDGKNDLFDPRDDSTGFKNNAALVLADWIVNVLGKSVDWDEVADEANASDVSITNAEAGTQPRWVLNGTLSDEQTFEDQRAQLAAACDAFIYERTDGKVGFTVGRWIEPTLTLGPDDFFAFEISEGQWGADAPDEVAAVYTEPENAWRETPSGTWVENDVAKPVKDEPQLFMITNHNQASRINKRLAKTKRAQYQLRGTLGMVGYEILGGRDNGRAQRFIRVVHPEMGIDEYFEIGELARENVSTFTLSANSVKPSDFDFDAALEEPARPAYGSVTNDGSVPAPTTFAGGALENGTILFTWDEQDAAYTQEIRYRETGETYWLSSQTAVSTDRHQLGGFADGVTIEAQIRNRSSGSGVSDWAPETPIEIETVIDPVAPGDLSGFTVDQVDDDVLISFVAPNDAHYFGTRIYKATSSTFGAASLIHTEYGIPSDGDSYTDALPGTGTFYYWVQPINSSEKPGTLSGPQSVTVTAPGP
ncbi:hypothetical protein [Phaeobacter sp. 22II1-1F12B]|uniref:hypothetical protein n=1 Tax=Phaeobacter sp. 22II1-1F12B TaxID=1317111 RepID=UPI000B522217|nr:hypothetical protein [Phaeobacter sp. 22II1-1F12B]OWU80428.1 fibronectin [Phaeobacter sp. 22II1-1F12B]